MNKRVTITDIAKAAGVAPTTVSAVLRDKPSCYASASTKERIKAVARQLGYRPNLMARSLKNGRSRMIGLVNAAMRNDISCAETVALSDRLREYQYTTQVIYDRGELALRKSGCEALIDQGCDALVLSGICCDQEQEVIQKFSLPVFSLNSQKCDYLPGRTVFTDYRPGCEALYQRLAALNHQKVALISPTWSDLGRDPRYQCFTEFCQLHQQDPAAYSLILNDQTKFCRHDLEQFLHAHPEVTALVATNDYLAMQIVMYLQESGAQVPRDFSVIGFDDIPAASCSFPGICSIHKPIDTAVGELTKLILNVLENQHFTVQSIVSSFLVERPSLSVARPGAWGIANTREVQ